MPAARRVWVDCQRNAVICNGRAAILPPTAAELIAAMAAIHPLVASTNYLIESVYPNPADEPEWSNPKVHLCRARPLLARIGLKIEAVACLGYRLVIGEAIGAELKRRADDLGL